MEFKEKLKKAMLEKDLNQRECAKMFGVSESAISKYLSGTRMPSTQKLSRISETLGVSIDYILGISEEEK